MGSCFRLYIFQGQSRLKTRVVERTSYLYKINDIILALHAELRTAGRYFKIHHTLHQTCTAS